MTEPSNLTSTTKRLFFRGLAALLPTLVTLLIFIKLVGFLNESVGAYIGAGLTRAAGWAMPQLFQPSPEEVDAYAQQKGINLKSLDRIRRQEAESEIAVKLWSRKQAAAATSWQVSVIGFLVALVLTCVIGLFLASFVGRRLWRLGENALTRVPFFKQIYPYAKQVTEYVFGERKLDFSQVVAVQYPREGIWSVGFVTGPSPQDIARVDPTYVSVFMPTSPTPLTGFVINARKEDMIKLQVTIDQAFRYIISGGVITPGAFPPDSAVEAAVAREPGKVLGSAKQPLPE